MVKKFPNVLAIAGIDPSGGAGLLADIKTISALEAYACGVVTAITAQNTKEVATAKAVEPKLVEQQIDTLFEDVQIDAVKIGMLFDAATIKVVTQKLFYWKASPIVLDPVMVAKSGDPLLLDEAITTLKETLLPLSTVITPNLPEAECLLGSRIEMSKESIESACKDLWNLKGQQGWVVLKGGHSSNADKSEDYLYDGNELKSFSSPRISTNNTHGTGCALSSALAALIPQSATVGEAFKRSKEFISNAIRYSDQLSVGSGHGPIMHFYKQWKVI
ncbi:MAG: bifunctional hydroxymethylpyrimidine kinase/phosphomethylpyrimidine kinase [Burkholderiales bacterium]|nr:bifunctional hydroxymethylpyrimidine kinase/phosphomethylpyrimidine kinase [Burkholderiales bacterium]